MKLERFKPKEPKKISLVVFTVICILMIGSVIFYKTFAIFEVQKKFNIVNGKIENIQDLYFAVYINDIPSNSMPSPENNYMLDQSKSFCGTLGQKENDIKITYENGKITILNVKNARTKCTLYFKDPKDYDICKEKYGEESIQCKIINQYEQDKTKNLCPTVSDNLITNNTNETENELVCKAPDNYGESYYFRGTTSNNYVKFANFYWRIIRINGNGSIRMIYAGNANTIDSLPNKEEVLKNGYTDTEGYTKIQNAAFNTLSNDNAYVGYMYGTLNSETYEETHKNLNDSNIKTILENWYKENIKNKGYNYYIDDNIFCNQREVAVGSGLKNEATDYKETKITTLMCLNSNDSFTVMDNKKGNAMLTFPIGLLTIDEARIAGSAGLEENKKNYIYTGYYYWTMTPWGKETATNYVRIFAVHSNGKTWYNQNPNQTWVGVRPVINLKENALQLGTGTWNDPYRISEN